MTKRLMLSAALLIGACTAASGTPSPNQISFDSREPVRWFQAASRLRSCFREGSTNGAFWAALSSSLGALDYFDRAPRELAAGARGRERVHMLVRAGYLAQLDPLGDLSCRTIIEQANLTFRRLSPARRKIAVQIASGLLSLDTEGRRVIAEERARYGARRARGRAPRRGGRRYRRPVLRPSEQQLPVGN